MASRRGRSETSAASRDPLRSLAAQLSMPQPSLPLHPVSVPTALNEVEDGRLWHPDPEQGALTIGGRFARVVVHKRPIVARSNTLWSPAGLPVGLQAPVGLRFESPFKVVTCLRRKVRREIMFATGRGGKGVRKRRPRRSWRSNVSC